jgi:hypothetical protein
MNIGLYMLGAGLAILSALNFWLMHCLLKTMNEEISITTKMVLHHDIMLRSMHDALLKEHENNE